MAREAVMLPSQFNPLTPETVENPYPFYRAMREHAPIYRVPGAAFSSSVATPTFLTPSTTRSFSRRASRRV